MSVKELVIKDAQSFTMVNGEDRVLLLHGWTSWLRTYQYLANVLFDAGFSVAGLRFSGHGSTGEDFTKANWRTWLKEAENFLIEQSMKTYGKIYIIGHSMGGAIATYLAERHPSLIKKIVLLAPALVATNWTIWLTPVLRLFVKKFKDVRPLLHIDTDPQWNHMDSEYWVHDWIDGAYDLLRIMLVGRKSAKNFKVPALLVYSNTDDAVPPGMLDYYREKDNVQIQLWDNIGHEIHDPYNYRENVGYAKC
jgi:carboxylesterase